MIRYIDSHRQRFRGEPICKVLPIAPASYYQLKALERDPDRRSDRAKRDERLKTRDRARLEREFRGLRCEEGLAPDEV